MLVILDNASIVDVGSVGTDFLMVLPTVVMAIIAIVLIIYIKREVSNLEDYLYAISQGLFGSFDNLYNPPSPHVYSLIKKIENLIEDLAERTKIINRFVEQIDRQTTRSARLSSGQIQSDLRELRDSLNRLADHINSLSEKIKRYSASESPTGYSSIGSDELYRLRVLVDRLSVLDSKLSRLAQIVGTASFPAELQEQVSELRKNLENLRNSIALLSNEMKTLREEAGSLTSLIMRLTESGKLDLYRKLAEAIKKYIEVYNKIKERTDSGVLYGKMYEDFLRSIKKLLQRSYETLKTGKIDPEAFISTSEDISNAMEMLKTLEANIENPIILRVHRKITTEGSIAWPEIDIDDLEEILDEIRSYMKIE